MRVLTHEWSEHMDFEDFKVQSDVIKTGNGECGYLILPKLLCGCNPGEYGGYEYCCEVNCPLRKE